MDLESNVKVATASLSLQVYLLGSVEFEAALALQRRLHFEVSGDRSQGALILCEHPPLITVGRQGSRAHILCEAEELRARQWPIRWLNRGGGCLLHFPGQLALYAILPLDRLGLGVPDYLQGLQKTLQALLADFSIPANADSRRPAVMAGDRPIAAIGVAVRDWVSYFGAWINLNPPLHPYRLVRWGSRSTEPMTSLERERRGPLRPAYVRQRLVEHFCSHFPVSRSSFFSNHPALNGSFQRCPDLHKKFCG